MKEFFSHKLSSILAYRNTQRIAKIRADLDLSLFDTANAISETSETVKLAAFASTVDEILDSNCPEFLKASTQIKQLLEAETDNDMKLVWLLCLRILIYKGTTISEITKP